MSARIDARLLDGVAAIDLEPAKARLAAARWPRYLANELALEYRRFLLLLALHPGEPLRPAPLVDALRINHVRDGAAAERALERASAGLAERVRATPQPAPADRLTMERYERAFPGWATHYWRARTVDDVQRAVAAREAARR